MFTKTLEKLVLPVLEAAPFTSKITGSGNTIRFFFRTPRFSSHWTVEDSTKSQVLVIEASDIDWFTPDETGALERVNERSYECFGKFSVVQSRIGLSPELGFLLGRERLKYCLELPYIEDTTPAAFQHALLLALDTVATTYEGWQKLSNESGTNWSSNEKGLFDRIKDAFG